MDRLIKPVDFAQVIKDNMEIYATEVNENRAIPSIYDGLKPVQRRILYWLSENKGEKGYLGCAEIVGGILGAYHPHGDSSVYGALVRLSQSLIMNYPLIDFHGNNGSLTDPPAAFRYTKAKLSKYGSALLEDISFANVVKWKGNYNETLQEPCYLLGSLGSLNLLLNPQLGIGVGLASNFTCHHLNDVLAATRYRIEHPTCSLKELLEATHLSPSFHNSGVLINKDDIPAIYQTGKGTIILRAKYEWKSGYLWVTELPYRVDASEVRKVILTEQEKNNLDEVKEVFEENGKLKIYTNGIVDKDAFLKKLFKVTNLQNTYSINMTATDENGKPRLWPLLDILDFHIVQQHHRITNRAAHYFNQYSHKKHITEGVRKALLDIDATIEIIKNAETTAQALLDLKTALDIDDDQAKAILDIRLGRLTKMEKNALDNEIEALKIQIEEQQEIQSNSAKRIEVYEKEISVFNDSAPKTECLALISKGQDGDKASQDFWFVKTEDGYIAMYHDEMEMTDMVFDAKVSLKDEFVIVTDEMRGFTRQGSEFIIGDVKWEDLIKLNAGEKVLFAIRKDDLAKFEFVEVRDSNDKIWSLHNSFILTGASKRGKRLVTGKYKITQVHLEDETTSYPKIR